MHDYLSAMVGDILAHLRSLQPLPSDGLLGGGAVANLIWQRHSGNHAPVNDIDIFKVFHLTSLRAFCYGILGMDVPRQGNLRSLRYGSRHEGLLNHVKVYTEIAGYQNVIDHFDLNCTMVGIDLATEQLYCTPAFVEFLETGIVRIVNCHTPLHNAIRLVSKTHQLGARADFDQELRRLIAQLPDSLPGFGDKYASLFVKHDNVLGKYFDLVERDTDWTLQVLPITPEEELGADLF